jgi:hypothetical protein
MVVASLLFWLPLLLLLLPCRILAPLVPTTLPGSLPLTLAGACAATTQHSKNEQIAVAHLGSSNRVMARLRGG